MTKHSKIVLVTGAAGFIGSHVSDVLLARGDTVVAIDEMNDYYDVRLKEANLSYLSKKYGDRIKIYTGDICDLEFMKGIFEKEKPTYICHLAARAGVRPSIMDPYIYVHSNIEGTTRLLDLARQFSIKNFVYASSSSVYGSSTKELLSEEDVVERPVSPYAATKKACELLAYTFHHLYGLNCTGLRFFTVYGPRGRPDMAPFKFIDRVYNGLAIQQYGDGSTSRDYTYIDDIVDGVVRSIDRPLGYEVINLGNGRPFLLKDFIRLVEKSVGKQAIIEVLPEQPGDVERTCADISKAKRLLGYQPKVTFEVGIQRTAEWYKIAYEEGLFHHDPEKHTFVYNFIISHSSSSSKNCTYNQNKKSHKTHKHHTTTISPPPSVLEIKSGVECPEDLETDVDTTHSPTTRNALYDSTSSSESIDEDDETSSEISRTSSQFSSSAEQDGDEFVEKGHKKSYHHSQTLSTCTSSESLNMIETLVEPSEDLELSSNVQKAPKQLSFRSNRFIYSK